MNLGALVTTAVPVILGLLVKLVTDGREPAKIRNIRRLGELRESLPTGLQERLDPLLHAELDALVATGQNRLRRKFSGAGIAAVVVVSFLLFGANALLALWALSTEGWTRWIIWAAVALFGLFSVLFVAAGLPSIYDKNPDQSAASPQ